MASVVLRFRMGLLFLDREARTRIVIFLRNSIKLYGISLLKVLLLPPTIDNYPAQPCQEVFMLSKRTRVFFPFLLLVAALLATSPALAQSTATLQGTVSDSKGAVLAKRYGPGQK